jgi:crotonobetainyl-CoA:carnitine CoA-transferase CaiB-like acyl-CoA transferase
VIAVITDNFWQNLKEVVNCQEFDDEVFDGQPGRLAAKDMIDGKLTEIFATNTTAHWLAQLNDKRIPCAPVNKFSQALSDEQVLHRNMVVEVAHPNGESTKMPGNPIKLSRTGDDSFTPPPLLGANSDEVFGDILGYKADKIASLKEQGAVK